MQYQHMGRIEGQLSIPRKPVFAVIELGATQYKVPISFPVFSFNSYSEVWTEGSLLA